MKIGRRRFVGFVAGAAAGAVAGFPAGRELEAILASAESPFFPPRGPESAAASVCTLCPAGCGVRARRIGDRIVKLEGNPLHPISRGRLCVKGQAALQALNHPDRVRTPLRRVGPRGSIDAFRRATWDEALGDLSARLAALREQNRSEALVLARGGDRSLDLRIARRFVAAFGSPNDICFERGDDAAAMALLLTQGTRAVPAIDLRNADYVLSIGSELLDASPSPVYLTSAYGDFRQTRTATRGKLVHVDPRLSVTGSSADEWIPIRPGMHAIFALGVASCMVAEGLYDREFVAARSTGFEDEGGSGLAALLRDRYRLEDVAAETGVSVSVILRVAREFARSKRSIAVGPRKGPLLPGSLFDHLATHVLNALVGNIDEPGGVLLPEPAPLASLGRVPAPRRPRLDAVDAESLLQSDPERLAEALLSRRPYPADVLIVAGADPLFASAAPDRFAAALERVACTATFAGIPNDTALHSDWILPEAHFLERWELHANSPAAPFPVASLASPATTLPDGGARAIGEVFLDLAKRCGLDGAFPGDDCESIARAELDGIFDAHRGAIVGTEFDEAWVRMMETAGWWAPGYRTADELWARAADSGGWWDPFYDHGDWDRVLCAGSSRFDFRPDLLRDLGEEQRPFVEESSRSLALLLFEPLAVSGGSGAELPFLESLLDPGHPDRWGTWGEINPETARRLGVRSGDTIRVSTGEAAVAVRAMVTERVVPDLIAIPLGLGKRGGGRWAARVGENPLRLVGREREAVSRLPRLEASVQISVVAIPERRRS
ncbi:MAG TPA: molybdopterin-dependent oxidoreductase [Thermoanaerobaculia bacterium]